MSSARTRRWSTRTTPFYTTDRCADPQWLLNFADRILQAESPSFAVEFGPNDAGFMARWDYPGRVSVYCLVTGELVAQSRLHQPTAALAPKGRKEAKP